MHNAIAILSIIFSATLVACLIIGMRKAGRSASGAQIGAALRYYKVGVVAAAIGVGLDLFELNWWSLIDVAALVIAVGTVRFAVWRLKMVQTSERIEVQRLARENDLPWIDGTS